ncbi:uncharacterized protein LOC130284120 [Hyla sarda]|uniref:uncharacterized protein LOC130284120 n=1 Tax=Hyla sarda TaxID=327740 RepID=UPI0024C3170C|nr:uncharacterized protein LOC130284120 [Hyla sarda]
MSCFGDLVSAVCFPCAVLGLVIRYIFSMICGPSPSRRVVGIFSRSASEDYEWLTTSLNSAMFKNLVMESRSVYISNRDQNRFREAVQSCDFGILYHTKNHGRINITNVTDSIYDEQLELMSSSRGRVNVIVMVDDLEKSDYEEKCRIIDSQPDILKYSQDLILVSSNEKRQPQLLERKLQDIKALISAGSRGPGNFCDDLASMTRWVSSNVDEILRRSVSMFGRRIRGELDEPLLA